MKKFFNKPFRFLQSHPKLDLLLLAGALIVFGAIALFNITNASIWFDEAFSAYIIQFSYADIARFTATDVHPPLYYWALKAWTDIFGATELGMRSMSLFFAAGAMIVSFFLTRRLFGRKVAIVTLLFLTLSPMLIRYSDEARMYTMAAFIAVSATYVLVKALEAKQKRWWVFYGILVSLGMWTHYFTALVWLSHWAWHAWATYANGVSFKTWWKRFFTKDWVLAHVIAVALFLPWLYFMIKQLGVVQAAGFWIGPVSVSTPTNYLSNIFYYIEQGQAQGWLAVALLIAVGLLIVLTPKAYKSFNKNGKSNFILIAAMAWVPPILLFITSLPPLRPSFVERYLVPASIAFLIFTAIVMVAGTKRWRPIFRALPILLISGMMIFGITNVYKYGNYNKNTNTHTVTRQIIEKIHDNAEPGQPIVTTTPWLFYEAAPYATAEHPVYFIDDSTQYIYGSLDMLKYNDMHKIQDLNVFARQNPVIWYLGQADSGDVAPYKDSWQKIETISYYDSLVNKDSYRATQYRLSAE